MTMRYLVGGRAAPVALHDYAGIRVRLRRVDDPPAKERAMRQRPETPFQKDLAVFVDMNLQWAFLESRYRRVSRNGSQRTSSSCSSVNMSCMRSNEAI